MIYVVLLFLSFFSQFAYAKRSKERIFQTSVKRYQIDNLYNYLSVAPGLNLKIASPVEKIKWSPDNIHIATCGYGNLVRIWNAETGALIWKIGSHNRKKLQAFSWSPDGKRLATTHADNHCSIFDLNNVFKMENAIESLSPEQLALMDVLIAENSLKKLDEEQKKTFQNLPDIVKGALDYQFSIRKDKPGLLR